MGTNIIHKWWKYHEEIIFRYLVIKKSLVLNGPLWKFIIYYMIIICSVWFANTKLQAFPFYVVKKLMYNSGLFCCKSCRQNPIFYSFLLKKFCQKKIFHQKKSKNQNWPIFDFSLIGSPVFELETKTAKLRKQVELGHWIVSTCLGVGWLGNPRWVGNPMFPFWSSTFAYTPI